ncbi:hypothetical protein PPL_04285 [Heterostelium album PN500]|uniref:Uncharacterized protein n=1 Tax=Heterostelium pallidum (strain ATCC 26659 / Pp 5 / PN500) TaxID=670386 RepID=D3B751_HETP5|nr:hypothetical protein PPL_04285 [Heterostelium album PN500]EFA82594.1 hypothetical protein PPL_04285 [Heterostelium album PN500]|eukprot:XP_020434711.1 hypothetical protein PPL_04285 [Heterostelium album PN500]
MIKLQELNNKSNNISNTIEIKKFILHFTCEYVCHISYIVYKTSIDYSTPLDCNWCSGFWIKLVGVICILLAGNLLITIGCVLLYYFLISLLLFEIRSSAANIVSARDIKLFIV